VTQNLQVGSAETGNNRPLRFVLAGGSGHLGAVLQRHLRVQGHDVTILSRRRAAEIPGIVTWDAVSLGSWVEKLDRCDVLINLCGRSVDCRSTPSSRREIMESRVRPTHILGEAIRRLNNPPRLWLNASTGAIYRHSLDRAMDESNGELGGKEPDVPRSWDFSVDVGRRWEEAFFSADVPNTRRVALRSAVVMSADRGSIFDVLLRLVRFRLGGTVGNGKQFVSWIHETDFVRAMDHLIARDQFTGVVNITSPNPVANKEFMRSLRDAWGTRIGLPAPRPILEIGTYLMRTESELVLKSRRTVPRRLLEDGFQFLFTEWSECARELVGRWRNGGRVREEKDSWNLVQEARIHERAN
jgi:uncharacterized protein (TIGR01777 family)